MNAISQRDMRALIRCRGLPPQAQAPFWRPHEDRPLAEAVASANRIIGRALKKSRRAYIAYSAGKDSTVVRHLVERYPLDTTLMWNDNELEFPEVVSHVASLAAAGHLTIVAGRPKDPHGGWFFPWAEWPLFREPLPGTVWQYQQVRYLMREQGHDTAFVGLRSGESVRRFRFLRDLPDSKTAYYHTPHGHLRQVYPLWDWSDGDVWAYISQHDLPVVSVYDTMTALGVPRYLQRVGPLPLASPDVLRRGWPDLHARLVARYEGRFSDA